MLLISLVQLLHSQVKVLQRCDRQEPRHTVNFIRTVLALSIFVPYFGLYIAGSRSMPGHNLSIAPHTYYPKIPV